MPYGYSPGFRSPFSSQPFTLRVSICSSRLEHLRRASGAVEVGWTARWTRGRTRNGGILLRLPLLILYLYGPRADRAPDRVSAGWRIRYRPKRDILWIGLLPLGLAAYMIFLSPTNVNPLAPFLHQRHWGRSFIPLTGVSLGIWSAIRAIAAVMPGLDPSLVHHISLAGGSRRVVELAFFILSLVLLWLCWKLLPFAYTAWAAGGIVMAASIPSPSDPLRSFLASRLFFYRFRSRWRSGPLSRRGFA